MTSIRTPRTGVQIGKRPPRAWSFGSTTTWLMLGLRLLSIAVVLGAWEWYGRRHPFSVAPPSKVFTALKSGLSDGELISATLGTLWIVLVGLLVSLAIGLVLGFLIPLFPWSRNTIDPLVDAIYAMPVAMLIPVIGVYIGLGFRGQIAIVVTYVAGIIMINVTTGVRDVDKSIIETARSFGATGFRLWRTVTFPSCLPYITSSVALGAGRAVHGAIAAELLLVVTDLGKYMKDAGATLDVPKLTAGIVWTMILGLVVYWLAQLVERWLLRWRTHIAD